MVLSYCSTSREDIPRVYTRYETLEYRVLCFAINHLLRSKLFGSAIQNTFYFIFSYREQCQTSFELVGRYLFHDGIFVSFTFIKFYFFGGAGYVNTSYFM